MSGNTILHQALFLHGSRPLPSGPATAWPMHPSPSMISQGLAGSFQPSQVFNSFQKLGDRSHGSHDEARSQFLGGRRQSTAHPRVRSEPHGSRQARCPPLGLNLLVARLCKTKILSGLVFSTHTNAFISATSFTP
jgi:hypothetical protein